MCLPWAQSSKASRTLLQKRTMVRLDSDQGPLSLKNATFKNSGQTDHRSIANLRRKWNGRGIISWIIWQNLYITDWHTEYKNSKCAYPGLSLPKPPGPCNRYKDHG